MNYDPKLREAMFEIQQICDKFQIMSFMVLQSKTHGEFKFIWPEWSSVQNEGAEGMRIKHKVGVDDKKKLEQSVGCLMSVERLLGYAFIGVEKLNSELKKRMEIDHNQGPINNDQRGES